jgi:hypothetical protein
MLIQRNGVIFFPHEHEEGERKTSSYTRGNFLWNVRFQSKYYVVNKSPEFLMESLSFSPVTGRFLWPSYGENLEGN